MAFALVGSLGAVATGTSGATLTPAFGTGESRTAGNLLVLWAWVNSTTNPGAITNWSLAEQKGLGDSCSIYYKIATGGDAAPTVPLVSGGTIVAMLGEFSGNAAATPLDQVNLATTTATSPLVVTAPLADAASGELVIVCSATQYTSGTATDGSDSINNGATTHDTVGHLNTTNHWGFGWGITTGNSGADTNSWTFPTTSAAHAVATIASFKLLGGTNYTETLSGSLSFTGQWGPTKTTKALGGTLTFAGGFKRATTVALTASLSFAGALLRTTTKTLAGALSFTGSVVRATTRPLTAALSFSGSLKRATTRPLATAVSFAGKLNRATTRQLTGSLSFSGSLSRASTKTLTAAVSFTGALTRAVTKALGATLSFTGALRRQITRALAAAVSFSGQVAKSTTRALSAGASFTGRFAKASAKSLAGGLSFSGSLSRGVKRSFSAAVSFAGSLLPGRVRILTFSGGLSFSGSLLTHVARAVFSVILPGFVAPVQRLLRITPKQRRGTEGISAPDQLSGTSSPQQNPGQSAPRQDNA